MVRARLSENKIIQAFIERNGGKHAPQLFSLYERCQRPVKDDEIAEKLRLKVTDVRTVFNRLHYKGIAFYQKTKNRKTGWYTYTWKIDKKRVLELVLAEQRAEMQALEKKRALQEAYSLFGCQSGCEEFPFEVAAEYQFRCPSCGKELDAIDEAKRKAALSRRIAVLKKNIEAFQNLTK